MKHLTILVPNGKGNNLSSIVGTYKLFTRANELWIQKGRKAPFTIQLAGVSKKVEFYDGLFSVKPHVRISEISVTDMIVIPSLNHNYHESVRQNKALIGWIGKHYQQGAEVASICTGAFLLASTGLIDGRSCSTHWSAEEEFRMRFPKVKLERESLITDEHGIYTNGGAYSFLNLIVYLIEKYYDRQTAILCSKIFQIELDRNTQSAFSIFTGQKMHDDEIIKKAQSYIEKRPQDRITAEALSARFALGRRNFDRRFFKATGNTPLEYAQRVKVESAKRSLESSRKNISEVMFESGYADEKAFREVFRKLTGLSPLEYRNRYNKSANKN